MTCSSIGQYVRVVSDAGGTPVADATHLAGSVLIPRSARVSAAALVACVGFVLAVDAQHATSGFIDVALVAVALIVGAIVARRADGRLPLRVAGSIVALGAVWLLPQRTDVPSALLLGFLFGAGVGLVTGGLDRAAVIARIVIVSTVVLVAVRFLGSEDALVAIGAVLVIVAAALVERPERTASRSRARTRVTATVLIVSTVGFGMYVGSETPSVHWFGGGITHGPAAGNEVALTFDDGPNLTATLPIVRILDAAGVKATFFEVGHAIDKVPSITHTLYIDGEGLGNHSYHHDQWRWLDPRYPELERAQDAFEKAIGICPAFYRPPHGDRTPFVAHVVNDHQMRMVLWNDSAGDWAEKDPNVIAERILNGVHPGSIIVLHDGLNGNPFANRTVLLRALPLILEGLRAKHLVPVRLDKLIGGPAFIPCH